MMTALVVVERVPGGREGQDHQRGAALPGLGRRAAAARQVDRRQHDAPRPAAAVGQRRGDRARPARRGRQREALRALHEREGRGSSGCVCTRFATPSGFEDKGNHSCAADLAAIARAVLREPRLARIVKRRAGGRSRSRSRAAGCGSTTTTRCCAQGYRGHDRAQDGLHGRRGPLPGRHGAARPGQARRRPAALARPRQAGDAAARPRLQGLSAR